MPASSRKRKASDDEDLLRAETSPNTPSNTNHDRMSASPSPSLAHQTLPKSSKRVRSNITGRPLNLLRLLETLDADALRQTLRTLVEQHPPLAAAVEKAAPRPTVPAALAVLRRYEERLHAAFPFGGARTSDYAFNRVRPQLAALRDALADFTPQFLPPHETQVTTSLAWLDGATQVIARLPDWDAWANALLKAEAYEEVGRAWVVALREAAKRAGGMMLAHEGWDRTLRRHDAESGGKLHEAVQVLDGILAWTGGPAAAQQQAGGRPDELSSIRQELLSGTYGAGVPMRVGPWSMAR